MKWTAAYFVGYVILVAGILAALWKTGVLQNIGAAWTAIGLVILLGAGVMVAVKNSGQKESISIEK